MTNPRWPDVALFELLSRSNDWETINPESDYRQVTMRLWGKGAVLRGTVKGSSIAAGEQLRVKPGQFILSKIDARNGAFGLIPNELDGAVVSSDFPVFNVDAKRLVPQFLNWISKTEWFVALCRTSSEGSTNRVRLKEERFLAQQIPLPPVIEQQRIAARLDTAAEKIRRVRELKDAIAVDVGSFITAAHFEASGDRKVDVGTLLELYEDHAEVAPATEYPQVGIKGFGGGLFAKPPVQWGETTYRYLNRLYDGALVVSQPKGWEGAIGVCGQEFSGRYASPEYRTFRCKQGELLPSYLSYIIRTSWFLNLLAGLSRGQGARRERLRPEMLLSLRIPMPEVQEQAKLERAFARVSQLRSIDLYPDFAHLIPAMLDQLL